LVGRFDYCVENSSIEEKLSKTMEDVYRRLNNKLASRTNTIRKPKKTHNDQKRNTKVINLSCTQFNSKQICTMALGQNFAIIKKPQSCINELIAETEYAIRKLDAKIQNPYTYMAAVKIKQITESHTTYQEHKIIQNTINKIREILHRDDLVIMRADKNKVIVIIE
jgi:hypothetical protein